jgi:hypothetical protein
MPGLPAPNLAPLKMNKQQALNAAIDLTDEILELLDSGEFERVGALEAKRKPVIEQAFAASIEQIDLIRAHHLQSLNQQIVDKLELFKQSVIMQQNRLRTASKASQAYLSHDSVPK